MGKSKRRRGGVHTPAAKKKAGDKLRAHHRAQKAKPKICQVCSELPPVGHLLVDGERVWMCRICYLQDDPEYQATEIERHTRTGKSSLGTARG